MKTNYHTHCVFCDGKNTIEEMTQAAIAHNFDELGFSSHAIYPYTSDWHMETSHYKLYIDEIQRVKEKYKGQIKILTGFESDYFPLVSTPDKSTYKDYNPDFIIGSVHYVMNLDHSDKGYKPANSDIPINSFTVDEDPKLVQKGIDTFFDGDGKKMVQTYFALQREMIKTFDFNIIGHVDLIRKHNGLLHFFNENDEWYKNEIKETAKIISQSNKIVEINTGGIARKAINDSYPSLEFLQLLNKFNVPICINSDSHSIDTIDTAFDESLQKANKAGYTTTTRLSPI